MEEVKEFQVRSYGWQELACLYKPHVSPASASKALRHWVSRRKGLKEELIRAGWRPGNRSLTCREVAIIIRELGEP